MFSTTKRSKVTMFGPGTPFWYSNLGQYIFKFGSTRTTSSSFMDLTPLSITYTRRPLPYLFPSDILGCSIGISLNLVPNLNNPSSPTIACFSTQSTSQVTTMTISQPVQTSIVGASLGSSFMPSISLENVVRHYSNIFCIRYLTVTVTKKC